MLLHAILLGVVQGLTEFLPVSSSAHLILARAFFGWDSDVFGVPFDVACHLGTLAAVVLYFWRDLLAMFGGVFDAFRPSAGLAGRRVRNVVIGTLPIVAVGLYLGPRIEASMRTPLVAAITLAIGGLAFLLAERIARPRKDDASITATDAFVIGIAQSAALVPGVSRSGSTIATGLFLGIERAAVARFSFLLSIPAIVAAAAKEGLDLRHAPLVRSVLQMHAVGDRLHAIAASGQARLFAVGMVTSAIVGYVTIGLFLRFLARHRLDLFAWYRLGLASATFIWLASR